jgi:HEAT repeat protein
MPLIRNSNRPPAPDGEATPPAAAPDVDALSEALASEADLRAREAILTRLMRIGGPAAAEAIVVHVASDDAGLRTAAMDALRAMPASAAACLDRMLGGADPDVRLLACELARGAPGREPALLLQRMLEVETEPNVCAAAIEVLAEIGGPDALPVLARCAERFVDEPFLAFSIKVASDRIGAEMRPSPGHHVG